MAVPTSLAYVESSSEHLLRDSLLTSPPKHSVDVWNRQFRDAFFHAFTINIVACISQVITNKMSYYLSQEKRFFLLGDRMPINELLMTQKPELLLNDLKIALRS